MLLGIGARKNGIVTIKPGQAVAAAFRATAAFTSALKARASTFSPSWMSIALRVLPSRLELKRRDGSGRLAPWAKVSFTACLYDSPVQTIPSCDQTGTPAIPFDGFLHFRSSIISGSASRISARSRGRERKRHDGVQEGDAPRVAELALRFDLEHPAVHGAIPPGIGLSLEREHRPGR